MLIEYKIFQNETQKPTRPRKYLHYAKLYEELVPTTWSWSLYTNCTFSKIIDHIVISINMWVESVIVPNFTRIKNNYNSVYYVC